MMTFAVLLLWLLFLGPSESVERTYVAYMPHYIRVGEPYTVDIDLVNITDPINFQVQQSIHIYKRNFVFQLSAEASHKPLVFEPLPVEYAEIYEPLTISINGTNQRTGQDLLPTSTTVLFATKTLSIFIQTDKAIYQPGQTIKFRAVVTTPDLRPYRGNVTYTLQDPSSNTVLKVSDAQLVRGVVGDEFKLGRYAELGSWQIKYEGQGFYETADVKVEEYKLPKWSVHLKTDQQSYGVDSKRISGEVSAEYTFKQPVRGSAYVLLEFSQFYSMPVSYTLDYPNFVGKASFDVSLETIEQAVGRDPIQPDGFGTLTISTGVKNNNTGKAEYASKNLFQDRDENEWLERTETDAVLLPQFLEILRPGLPFTRQVRLSKNVHNATKHRNAGMSVDMVYGRDNSWQSPEQRLMHGERINVPVEVGPDGVVTLKTTLAAGDFVYVIIGLKIQDSAPNTYLLAWYESIRSTPAQTYIRVSPVKQQLSSGETARMKVYTTVEPQYFRILVTCRGKMVKSEILRPQYLERQETFSAFVYSFSVNNENSPRSTVVVSFVTDDGQLVTDSGTFDVSAVLQNEVTMTTFPNITDAGMPVSIKVKAEPGSFVGLKGIDQSVNLLQESGNDITRKKIIEDFYGYSALTAEYTDYERTFQDALITVLSDVDPVVEYERPLLPEIVECPEPACSNQAGTYEQPAAQDEPPTRKYFPESWIWTDTETRDDGTVTLNYTVPDTITTWEITGFAISDDKGLGVTKEASQITVFRTFFVSLDLPPSVVRGEILRMKVTVFNYFEQDILATITLTDNEWYDIIEVSGEMSPSGVRTITIPFKDSRTIIFPIEFRKAGNARIQIRAQSPLAADQVERTLRVKPEGIPASVSSSSIIDRRDENEPETMVNFKVDIPPDVVEGSAHVKIAVSGNILGSALSNLGNLLAVPYGCGEQNMMNFAPDVYISQYLKKVDKLTGGIKRKSESHIREGYYNELRYVHKDGSYSAFGEYDKSGSTWLTAFVAKVFRAANELNPDLIEETKIKTAIEFILGQQNDDGTFNDPGYILDSNMQGGVNSDKTTAAYILIALAEGGKFRDDKNMSAAVAKTQRYLESNMLSLDDMFTLSISAYALALVESDNAQSVLRIVDSMATTEGNLKYWQIEETGAAKCMDFEYYCPYDFSSTSSSIEMTSYVLLAYLKQGRINEVMPIVRWLVKQRGAFGGYHSTQDTVMAIQALSEVAGHFSPRLLDLNINVAHDGQSDFGASFQLNDENAILLQITDLPSVSGNVVVSGTGRGVADIQVSVGYNLPVGPRSDEPFVVDVKFRKSDDNLIMKVCSRINEDREGVIDGTGMYVVTFKLPSGYTIDDRHATELNPNSKLVELVDEEVTGYFDELPLGRRVCLDLELIKYAEIENLRPKIVTCYDYYKPEIAAMRMLALPPEGDCPCCEANSTEPCCECIENLPEPPPDSYCGTDSYPCPDFADGLFYDPNSHVYKLSALNPDGNSCTAYPNDAVDSRSFTGLPASNLDGGVQHIECTQVPHLEEMLTSPSGWTFSIAIYPTVLNLAERYVIAAIYSENTRQPYVTLAKRRRHNQYGLWILYNGQQIVVRSVSTRHIPRNRWSLITARLDGRKPSLFVNGEKVGRYSRRQRPTGNLSTPISLRIGSSVAHHTRNFKGLVANFDAWTKPLSDEEIKAHYNYWEPSMTHENPTLDVAKVHHVVPPSIRKCFNKPYTSRELKSRSGFLRTDCD